MKTVELSLPATNSKYVWSINMDAFQKGVLESYCMKLAKYFDGCEIKFGLNTAKSNLKTFTMMKERQFSAIRKPDYVEFLSSFFSTPGNYFSVMDASAPEFISIWRYLIMNPEMKKEMLDRMAGKEIKALKAGNWSNIAIVDEPMLFGLSMVFNKYYYSAYSNAEDAIREVCLTSSIRNIAARYILPPGASDARTLDSLPHEAGCENFEAEINQEVDRLRAYASSNTLFGSSDNVVYSKVKAMQKKGLIEEFKEYGVTDWLSRGQIIGGAYMSMLLHNKVFRYARKFKEDSATDLAVYIVNDYPDQFGSATYRTLLPYYEGFLKSVVKDARAKTIAAMIRELIAPAADRWLDMSNFKLRYLLNDKTTFYDSYTYTRLFTLTPDDLTLRRSDIDAAPQASRKPDSNPDMWRDLTWAFVESYIRLLVAAGILEQAFAKDTPVSLENSFVRLTGLGKYAFGLTKDYTVPVKTGDKTDYELDDRNMIITLLNPDSHLRFYFERYGRAIGRNRFHLTAGTIINASADRAEAVRSIGNLRKVLEPEKDSVWDKMLVECGLRASASRQDSTRFILVTLNPDTPGLIDFINGNSDIRAHIVRTEDARILVEDSYYKTLVRTLRAAGYLID